MCQSDNEKIITQFSEKIVPLFSMLVSIPMKDNIILLWDIKRNLKKNNEKTVYANWRFYCNIRKKSL